MKDQFQRNINYMRISVTDRCNLRCIYCMPDGIRQIPMQEILTYEEILEVCRAAAGCGITRFKVTGGEPLVRPDVSWLIGRMSRIPGVEQVTLTTNGILLERYLTELLDAGLQAVNISLDTLKKERFRKITGADQLSCVLSAIHAACASGLQVKVNCVPQRGVNDDELQDLVQLAEQLPLDVRFIEMMPIGMGKRFRPMDNDRVLGQIRERYPKMEEDHTVHGNGPAVYYRIPGFCGSIGVISAIHGKFCSSCNRIRMTSEGRLKSCLADGTTMDVRRILRGVKEQDTMQWLLKDAVMTAIRRKPEQHHFDEISSITEQKQMVSIGG